MSLFTKTVVVRGGLSRGDAEQILEAFKAFAGVVGDRLREQDVRIDSLQSEIAALKREPRQSLGRKLKERGLP